MKSGLYAVPGFSATWIAAARAIWLALPLTKFEKVKPGLRRCSSREGRSGGVEIATGSGTVISVSTGFSSRTRFTLSRRPATRSTRDSILFSRLERTQRSTWWLGATRTSWLSCRSALSGLIQVSYCWAGNSFLSSAASDGQSESMGEIEWGCGGEKRGQAISNFIWIGRRYPQAWKALKTLTQWKACVESAIISGFSPLVIDSAAASFPKGRLP